MVQAGTTAEVRRAPGILLALWLVAGTLAAPAAHSKVPLTVGAEALGLTCAQARYDEGAGYTLCGGEIPSFDGLPLDTVVAFPEGAAKPLPTVLLLHALGGEGRLWVTGRTDGTDACGGACPGLYHLNVPWFVSRGYAVIAYTARGFFESCGPTDDDAACATSRSWTHLAERGFEVRDSEHVLGLLVDHEIADPARLGAVGTSYGAGQVWLLATSLPWDTPAAGQRLIQLAAAVPQIGWTDLLNSLAPNGRATERSDQSVSHERPFGVLKESWFDQVHAGVHALARVNSGDPSELHSFIDGWQAVFKKGEPYDGPETEALAAALRGKSAYYAEDYFAALRAKTARAVPIFAVQGWTDTLFPPVEALQMYRRLRSVDPNYPISIAFGDLGHPQDAGEMGNEWHELNDRATAFLDAFVGSKGHGRSAVGPVSSFVTQCPTPDAVPPPDSAATWDDLSAPGTVLTGHGTQTTGSAGSNPDEEAATDPLAGRARCAVLGPRAAESPSARWTWPAGSGLTLLGLPRLEVAYLLAGRDATVVAKLWDVSPDDPLTAEREDVRTLVSRGVYRLSASDAGSSVVLEMFGNHWRFDPGHAVQLELSQTDASFLRPDNLPATISFSSPVLTLPSMRTPS
jgi:predicted acyl esterase